MNVYALNLNRTFPTHTSRQVMFFTAGNFGCLFLKFTLQEPDLHLARDRSQRRGK